MKIHFVINQDLFDGSAHALYCYRNCWWLATTAPAGHSVELIFPGENRWSRGDETQHAAEHFCLGESSLKVTALPAWRRKKHARGLTLNFWFTSHARRHLRTFTKEGDVFITASFPKLLKAFASTKRLRTQLRWIYEVHQLAKLDFGTGSARDKKEAEALALAQGFVTTTGSLAGMLEEGFPAIRRVNLGLACGQPPADIPPPPSANEAFTLGYLGSLYGGQGVEWLVTNWATIRERLGVPAKLVIGGGSEIQIEKIRIIAETSGANGIEFAGHIPPSGISSFLASIHALIIPSAATGRMPFVAITKAYDYLAYQRPVIASSLPSITEIMRPDVEALVFEPMDLDGLVRCAKTLLNSPEEGNRLTNSALERCGSFTWEARARKYWRWLME